MVAWAAAAWPVSMSTFLSWLVDQCRMYDQYSAVIRHSLAKALRPAYPRRAETLVDLAPYLAV